AGQIVDAANAVPAFDSSRRVAARKPPPASFAIGAVMNARDLSKLQCVHDQTNVAMPGKPDAVRLKCSLVAIASSTRMSADIQNGREPLASVDLGWSIQVRGHVQSRPALVIEHLHGAIPPVLSPRAP